MNARELLVHYRLNGKGEKHVGQLQLLQSRYRWCRTTLLSGLLVSTGSYEETVSLLNRAAASEECSEYARGRGTYSGRRLMRRGRGGREYIKDRKTNEESIKIDEEDEEQKVVDQEKNKEDKEVINEKTQQQAKQMDVDSEEK